MKKNKEFTGRSSRQQLTVLDAVHVRVKPVDGLHAVAEVAVAHVRVDGRLRLGDRRGEEEGVRGPLEVSWNVRWKGGSDVDMVITVSTRKRLGAFELNRDDRLTFRSFTIVFVLEPLNIRVVVFIAEYL